jgi:hypothetical protein
MHDSLFMSASLIESPTAEKLRILMVEGRAAFDHRAIAAAFLAVSRAGTPAPSSAGPDDGDRNWCDECRPHLKRIPLSQCSSTFVLFLPVFPQIGTTLILAFW